MFADSHSVFIRNHWRNTVEGQYFKQKKEKNKKDFTELEDIFYLLYCTNVPLIEEIHLFIIFLILRLCLFSYLFLMLLCPLS